MEKPETIEELKTKIEKKCKLKYGCSVTYEDPDFDNALCNLEDMGDLPDTRAIVKVIPLVVTATTTSTSDASCASDDRDSVLTKLNFINETRAMARVFLIFQISLWNLDWDRPILRIY